MLQKLGAVLTLLMLATPMQATERLGYSESWDVIRGSPLDLMTDDVGLMLVTASWALARGQGAQAARIMEQVGVEAQDDPAMLVSVFNFCRQYVSPAPYCKQTAIPIRLTVLEPENGAPWLYLARYAFENDDLRSGREALLTAAKKKRFNGHFGGVVRMAYQAIHRLAPDGFELDPSAVWPFALGVATQGGNFEADLEFVCSAGAGDPVVDAACRRIAARMVDEAYSLAGMATAARVLSRSPDLSDFERRRIDEVHQTMVLTEIKIEEIRFRFTVDPDLVERVVNQMSTRGELRAWQMVIE